MRSKSLRDEGYSWPALRSALWQVAPAIVCGGGLTIAICWALLRAEHIAARYRAAAQSAWAKGDAEQSSFYLQRLVADRRAARPEDLFLLARAENANGDHEEALGILRQLAPDDRQGYPPAHRAVSLQLANRMELPGDGGVDAADQQRWSLLEHHLDAAQDETSPETLAAWTQLELARGRPEKALERFKLAVREEPSLWLAYARLQQQLGQRGEAQESYAKAVAFFADELQNAPENERVRILLVGALAETGDVDRAMDVVRDGLRRSGSPQLRALQSELKLLAYDQQLAGKPDFTTRLEALHAILEENPGCSAAYQRIEQLYQSAATEEHRDALENALNAMLTSGKGSALAHFSLGNFCALQGNRSRAIWHYEQAYRTNGQLPLLLNNLAWMLASQDDADLGRAEALALKAVELLPNEPRCRDTLGYVLLQQAKYDEAIEHLEVGLSFLPDSKGIHLKLAEAYRALGMDKLAEAHLKQSR